MATQKFVYTVSGIELSEAQKTRISQEIASAVARVILGESREAIQPDLLTLHGVAGGKMYSAAAAKSTEAFISSGCGGGGEAV